MGNEPGRTRRAAGRTPEDRADAKDEHEVVQRTRPRHPKDQSLARKPGHYAAGADGTQDVVEEIADQPKDPGDHR